MENLRNLRLVIPSLIVLAACGTPSASSNPELVASPSIQAPSTSTTSESTVEELPAEGSTESAITNSWVGSPIDITRLPIGTKMVSVDSAAIGGLFACDGGNPNGGGAHGVGPWIDELAQTWDLTKKIAVSGEVSWPMASYSEVVENDVRIIRSNGLPVGEVTGTFPIAASDPAFAFDRNPNSIAAQATELALPVNPETAEVPECLGKGAVGILKNGVSLFAPIDEKNRDAVVYETQDQCDGHPQQTSVYHYHDIPSCILDAAVGSSTVVGFAIDGFPIVVERDLEGDLPTNADLDECHGRVSEIILDGAKTISYHYSATREFPYFIGCFRGVPRT